MSVALDRSSGSETPQPKQGHSLQWALWWHQIRAILRLEVRKTLFGRRSLPVYVLAALPLPIFFLVAIFPPEDLVEQGPPMAGNIYAAVYNTFILRAILFIGCVWIFANLIRGEIVDRSLHYYFLSPLRREVLVVGKYLSGLLITGFLFCSTTALTNLLIYVPFGYEKALDYLFAGPGLGQLVSYVGASFLACLGYGAVFLTLGLFFKNPILPAAVVLGWEILNFILPPFLKRISVIHYIKGLIPVPFDEGPFAVLTEPPPVWIAVGGLLLFTALVLAVGGYRIRRMEIHYSQD